MKAKHEHGYTCTRACAFWQRDPAEVEAELDQSYAGLFDAFKGRLKYERAPRDKSASPGGKHKKTYRSKDNANKKRKGR